MGAYFKVISVKTGEGFDELWEYVGKKYLENKLNIRKNNKAGQEVEIFNDNQKNNSDRQKDKRYTNIKQNIFNACLNF